MKKPTTIKVLNKDAFTAAGLALFTAATADKVAVLSFASDLIPGGHWLQGEAGQEESLCCRSTLAGTLRHEYYPMDSFSVVWSPHAVVFREDLLRGFQMFHDPADNFVVGVVSCGWLRKLP